MGLDRLIFRVATLTAQADDASSALSNLKGAADAATQSMGEADAASTRFAKILEAIGSSGGMQILGGDAPGGAQLLSQLEGLVREEREAMHNPHTAPFTLAIIHDSIQKIVSLIRQWAGPEAQDFNLEKFKHYIDAKDAASLAQAENRDAGTQAAIGGATQAITSKVEGSGKLVLGSVLHLPTIIGQQLTDAAHQIVDAINNPSSRRLRPSNAMAGAPPVTTGHHPQPLSFGSMISTGQI